VRQRTRQILVKIYAICLYYEKFAIWSCKNFIH
jgi:hypothetical protein